MKSISNFFKKIWYFIDKKIIVPITKIIIKITSRFDKPGRKFENWLSKTNTLLFISLILSILIFIAIDRQIFKFQDNSAEVLPAQMVDVIYNEEAYVVEGLPETVDITLVGSRANLYIAKQASKHKVTVDLTGLKPGSHKVNIEYNQPSSLIDYKINPSVATVNIYPKLSKSKPLSIDLLNKDSLNSKLVIKDVKTENDMVIVKGSENQLAQVSIVKALVNVENVVKQEVGVTTLKDIPLKAYDKDGNIVDVEIVPSKINAEIEIVSPNAELPIKVIPIGEVAFGKAIGSIKLNETKVKVYGDEKAIAELKYIPVEIDVSNLKENKKYKIEIEKPNGVTTMSINNVTIIVELETVSNRIIDDISIEYRDLSSIYTAKGLSENDIKVSVTLKGVKSVINQIKPDDIKAYLDLKGYTEGEHEVEVQIEGTDVKVQYVPMTTKVKIKIIKK